MTETALAKRDEVYALVSGGPIADLRALDQRLTKLREIANVLAPTVLGAPIPAKQAVALSVVQIDATTDKFGAGREVYVDRRFCDKDADEVALGRVAILKILAGAGISVVESKRIDDRSQRYYCEWTVTLAGRDLAGQWQTSTANKELDFRDGSPHLTKPEKIKQGGFEQKTGKLVALDDTAIADMRRHQAALCESKALLRAARNFPQLALAQKYKRVEVQKLWITPRLVPHLDASDPEDARLLRAEALGHSRQLYGVAPTPATKPAPAEVAQALPAEHEPAIEGEVVEPKEDVPEDFDFEAAATVIVCDCPCGDETEVKPAAAEITRARVGAVRCQACYPGKGFSFQTHPDDLVLQLPKWPTLTAGAVKRGLKK